MISKYVTSFGVELEGAIKDSEFRKFKQLNDRIHLVNDLHDEGDPSVHAARSGEDDVELVFWSDDLRKVLLATKKLYEQHGFHANASCGLHLHLKFKNTRNVIAFLSHSKKFYDDFKEEFERYACGQPESRREKYLNRTKPSSTGLYCKFAYSKPAIVKQLIDQGKSGQRYWAINLNAFNLNGTLEMREMPYASSYEEAKEEMLWTIKTLDKLLDKYKEKTAIRTSVQIPEAESNIEEETIEIPIIDIEKLKS
jgi:hypothetical protein